MVYPHRSGAGLASGSLQSRKAPSKWAERPAQSPRRVLPLTRRYEVSYLDSNGNIEEFQRVAPATPVFEDAFSAFARGALISTSVGPVAVEDLWPGALIETADAGLQPLQWLGSMTVFPDLGGAGLNGNGDPVRLFRVTADAFGVDRPAPDLMLGPRARVLVSYGGCYEMLGSDVAFAPVRGFTDGMSVIDVTPISAQRVYHLALPGQHHIRSNGLEIESYHPGLQPEALMDREMRSLFLTLFPHVETLEDFGQMKTPRLTAFELEKLRSI